MQTTLFQIETFLHPFLDFRFQFWTYESFISNLRHVSLGKFSRLVSKYLFKKFVDIGGYGRRAHFLKTTVYRVGDISCRSPTFFKQLTLHSAFFAPLCEHLFSTLTHARGIP